MCCQDGTGNLRGKAVDPKARTHALNAYREGGKDRPVAGSWAVDGQPPAVVGLDE